MKKARPVEFKIWGIVIGLLLVLTSRFAFVENLYPFDHIDARYFDQIARNILDEGIFSGNAEAPFCQESVRTPTYPYFLAAIYRLFGHKPAAVFIIQAMLDLLVAAVVFHLTYSFVPQKRFLAGMLALICYAFSLSQSRFTSEVLSEGLLTPLLALSVYFLWRALRSAHHRDAILAAVFLGLSVLCKPNVQFVPLAFGLALLMASHLPVKKRLYMTLVFILGVTVVLAPWLIRNYRAFDGVFLSHTFQDNLARVSAVSTLAEVGDEDILPWSDRWEELYGTLVTRAAVQYQWSGSMDPSCQERQQQHADVATVAVDVIGQHPVEFMIAHICQYRHEMSPIHRDKMSPD